MADKIAYYSRSEGDMTYSDREYDEVKDVVGSREVGDYYRTAEATRVTLYMDPANGLVVHDVESYESWLKGNRLT